MIFYFYIIASVVLYLIGDYIAKIWIENDKTTFFALAFTLCSLASLFFLFALKRTNSLSLTMINFSLISLLGGVAVGYFFFAEKLTSFQFAGLIFAIFALVLVGLPFETFQNELHS